MCFELLESDGGLGASGDVQLERAAGRRLRSDRGCSLALCSCKPCARGWAALLACAGCMAPASDETTSGAGSLKMPLGAHHSGLSYMPMPQPSKDGSASMETCKQPQGTHDRALSRTPLEPKRPAHQTCRTNGHCAQVPRTISTERHRHHALSAESSRGHFNCDTSHFHAILARTCQLTSSRKGNVACGGVLGS